MIVPKSHSDLFGDEFYILVQQINPYTTLDLLKW